MWRQFDTYDKAARWAEKKSHKYGWDISLHRSPTGEWEVLVRK